MSPPRLSLTKRGVVGLDQDILESLDRIRIRSLERKAGMGVKGDEINFSPQAPEESRQFPGMVRGIVHSLSKGHTKR